MFGRVFLVFVIMMSNKRKRSNKCVYAFTIQRSDGNKFFPIFTEKKFLAYLGLNLGKKV